MLLDRFAADGSADFIVRFTEQADLSAAYSMDWNARGEYVYNTLLETANRSQVNANAILNQNGFKYQTIIGGNDLYVWSGNLDVMQMTLRHYLRYISSVPPAHTTLILLR